MRIIYYTDRRLLHALFVCFCFSRFGTPIKISLVLLATEIFFHFVIYILLPSSTPAINSEIMIENQFRGLNFDSYLVRPEMSMEWRLTRPVSLPIVNID